MKIAEKMLRGCYICEYGISFFYLNAEFPKSFCSPHLSAYDTSNVSNSEKKTYDKCLRIKKFILETIKDSPEIHWLQLYKKGKMSENDKNCFSYKL
mgnify:CR=1 FL=1